MPEWGAPRIRELTAILKDQLRPYGLADSVVLYSYFDVPLPTGAAEGCLDLDAASSTADLLIEIAYGSTLIDIDPGILQLWVDAKQMQIARHDTYFTIGETIGQPGSKLPDVGLPWHYTPPCVSLEAWKVTPGPTGAPFTTVSQWQGGDWMVHGEDNYSNEKRDGFLPYLDLPRMTRRPLELALGLGISAHDEQERQGLLDRGWRVRHADEVSATPWGYQKYIQSSAGEFSCCKPSCVRLQNAWISDRTICYLASGRPAVVEHTGRSRFLPDASGLFRFKTPVEAARMLDHVAADYDRQSANARALAEEFFDAAKIAKRLLEISLA